jgi:hypothetical protein
VLVQMNQKITGYRDGAEWPEVGGVIDVPASEAALLIANGYAKEASDGSSPATADDAADDASAPSVEDGGEVPADGPEDAGTIEGAEVVKPKSPPRKRTSRKADA